MKCPGHAIICLLVRRVIILLIKHEVVLAVGFVRDEFYSYRFLYTAPSFATPLIDLVWKYRRDPLTFDLRTPWDPEIPALGACKEITDTVTALHFDGRDAAQRELRLARRFRDVDHVLESVRQWPETENATWEAFKRWVLATRF